jgi:hypothetical protein
MMAIKWMTTDVRPLAKERLLLIVSAAGDPPDGQLIGKSEVKIGFWTGEAFRLMDDDERPNITRWARLADFLPSGIDLVHLRRFDADVRE